jgi:hypothetical protein
MWSSGSAVSSRAANKRTSYVMLGINEKLTSVQNKRQFRGYQNDGANIDTPQNPISVTTINLAPPVSKNQGEQLLAPVSRHPLANAPIRRDFAFYCSNAAWMKQYNVVASAENPYNNAVPIFTNMGGVPVSMIKHMKYVGCVGNAGGAKTGDDQQDKFGNVYACGAITARNSGPSRLDPCSVFYLSPYPYVVEEEVGPNKGAEKPGYTDSGERSSSIDKYRAAPYQINDTDMSAFFHHIHERMRTFVNKHMAWKFDIGKDKSLDKELCALGVHRFLASFHYAQLFAFSYKAEEMFKVAFTADVGTVEQVTVDVPKRLALMEHLDLFKKQLVEFWTEFYNEQVADLYCLGNPDADSIQHCKYMKIRDRKFPTALSNVLEFVHLFMWLKDEMSEIYLMSLTRTHNFLRSFIGGKTRYGAAPLQPLDYVSGYAAI